MSDRVAVQCGNCSARFAIPAQFVGKRGTCKKCGEKFLAQPVEEAVAEFAGRKTASSGPPTRPIAGRPAAQVQDAIDADAIERELAENVNRSRGTATDTLLDDTVMGWLNAESDDAVDDVWAPRVVTTSDLCPPDQVHKRHGSRPA
jgi:PHP family Zn ribbon phosphoesterase